MLAKGRLAGGGGGASARRVGGGVGVCVVGWHEMCEMMGEMGEMGEMMGWVGGLWVYCTVLYLAAEETGGVVDLISSCTVRTAWGERGEV